MKEKTLEYLSVSLVSMIAGGVAWWLTEPAAKDYNLSYWKDIAQISQRELRDRPVITNTVFVPLQRVWITSGELEHVQYAVGKAQNNDVIFLWPGVHTWPTGLMLTNPQSIRISGIKTKTNQTTITIK